MSAFFVVVPLLYGACGETTTGPTSVTMAPSASSSQEATSATGTAPRAGSSPTAEERSLESGTRMCKLGSPQEGIFYLYLISKADLDFSGCRNAETIREDGYSMVGNEKYGPGVDVRCYIDPNDLIGQAVGAVYSSSNQPDREHAYDFCRSAGGHDFN